MNEIVVDESLDWSKRFPIYGRPPRPLKTHEEAFRQAFALWQDRQNAFRAYGVDCRQWLEERFGVAYSCNGV